MTKISNQYSLTNVLFADAVNGRVGIGTSSPSQLLEVNNATSSIIKNVSGTRALTLESYAADWNYLTSTGNNLAIKADGAFNTIFFTNGTERMRITSAGNVGIGTTAPGAPLTVVGNSSGYSFYSIGRNNADNASVISFRSNSASTEYAWIESGVNSQLDFGTNGNYRMRITSGGNVGIGTSSPENITNQTSLSVNGTNASRLDFQILGTKNSGLVSTASGLFLETSTTIPLVFITNNTERMRITSGGNVGIGVSNPIYKLDVNGEIVSRGAATAAYSYEDRSNTANIYTIFASSGFTYFYNAGNRAQINMSNGAYTALSDVNKKKDFEQSNIGLNEVLQLKPTLYRFKTDGESSAKELGFIAQEVKEFIPQAYSESGEGDDKFIGLTEMPIIAALTKAIQEQQTQINELKALLNAH